MIQCRLAMDPRAGRRSGAKSGAWRLARVGERQCPGWACGYPVYFRSAKSLANAGSVEQKNLTGKPTAVPSQSSLPGGATASGQPAGRYTCAMAGP
jgi:hypothetical protein